MLTHSEKILQYVLEMCQNCLKCHFLNQEKITEKDGDLKICPPIGQIDQKNVKNMEKFPLNWFGNWFRKNLQYVVKICQNGQRCYFLNQKKVKQKDSKYNNSSLVGQIDCKNTKGKSKLLVNCFVNSFRKNPPISARNVPKLPEMSLFEPSKKSKKRIAISKLAIQ